MNDPESLSHLLQVCARKTEDFVLLIDSKHMVWLQEIEEAAKKMFSSDFTAEPELMPKTPSQKRRRKKRTSILPDENRDPSGRRISRRRSSVSWSSSVRRLSSRHVTKPLNTSILEEVEQPPTRVTRAKAQASTTCMPVAEKPLEELSSNMLNECLPQVKISADPERNSALDPVAPISTAPPIPSAPPAVTADKPSDPVTPEKNGRTAAKLKIANSSTPKIQVVIGSVDLTLESPQPVAQVAKELELSNHSVTPTGSKCDRRSVRRSIVGRKSTSCRASLANKYSLASKRENMTREAVRKSIRRSVSRKRGSGMSSSSSYKSYQSSIEEVAVKIGPETTEPIEEAPEHRRSLRARAVNKIAISNEPQRMVTRQSLTLNAETTLDMNDQTIRRKSYKRAVDDLSDDEQVNSPPRKKTPSPPCPPSKVLKPHMKTFLHTVQKNQLLMMTPGSIGKSFIAKSFIKRNTPLKVDSKEKERQRQEALRKKEEAELQRKQKMEEGKKRKQEELKLRREERQRKVLQARERVEQLEEEKKKKIEQKFAQIDEKVREDRLAEDKAKKKMTAKKQEEADSRRRQEEEARKLKAKLEEEERKNQELLQKRREEEEQERQRKFAEAKKMADVEHERQLAAAKEQERLRAEKEKERLEKEKALQLQKELEQAAQEREQRREAEECRRKEQQERLEQERQERLHKEMEAKKVKELETQKLREEPERIAKEKQAAVGVPTMNVTVDIQNSPACDSYEMTPKSYKPPSVKISTDDYGMDLNSDDSTDDETKPRKPIPAWASGTQLAQAMCHQYYHPIDVDKFYGTIESPKLEDMFYKCKPRYFKRTSSAVWHSPPLSTNKHLAVGYGLKKY